MPPSEAERASADDDDDEDDDDDDDDDDATGKRGAARTSELSNCASERVAGAANTTFSVPFESAAAAREL